MVYFRRFGLKSFRHPENNVSTNENALPPYRGVANMLVDGLVLCPEDVVGRNIYWFFSMKQSLTVVRRNVKECREPTSFGRS